MLNFNEIFTITLSLFAVIDILGSIPVLISMKEKMGHIHSERVTLVSGLIMVGFLFAGQEFLKIMGLDIKSFALAGAVVIFIVAMEMILERDFFRPSNSPKSGNIVPIAFPLIAGAGTLTTLVSLSSAYPIAEILISIGINLVVIYIVLKTMKYIEKALGPGGIAILRRVFGVVLLAIAIKIFKSNF